MIFKPCKIDKKVAKACSFSRPTGSNFSYKRLLSESVFFFFLKNVVIIHLMIDLQSKSPCSVRMQENTDQKNSEYGQFSGSGNLQWLCILASKRFWCLQHYQENDVYSGKLSTVKPLFIIITSCEVINCKAFQKINKLQKVWSCCNSQDNH